MITIRDSMILDSRSAVQVRAPPEENFLSWIMNRESSNRESWDRDYELHQPLCKELFGGRDFVKWC